MNGERTLFFACIIVATLAAVHAVRRAWDIELRYRNIYATYFQMQREREELLRTYGVVDSKYVCKEKVSR